MKKPFELNKALFEAVAACNYEEAERLLNLGADPLGSTDETDADEHLLGELFCKMQDNEALEAAFPKFLGQHRTNDLLRAKRKSDRITIGMSLKMSIYAH